MQYTSAHPKWIALSSNEERFLVAEKNLPGFARVSEIVLPHKPAPKRRARTRSAKI